MVRFHNNTRRRRGEINNIAKSRIKLNFAETKSIKEKKNKNNHYKINHILRFLIIHFLSNFLLDSYIIIRSVYFNEICFIYGNCIVQCSFSTKIFLLFCYFLWRPIFELHIFYMIVFVNKRLKKSLFLNLILVILYLVFIPFWFLFVSIYMKSDNLFLFFDLTFLIVGILIFLPVLNKIYKLTFPILWEKNKFQLLFAFTLLVYLSICSYLANLNSYFLKNIENGSNYFGIFIASFCCLNEMMINYVFSRLYIVFKKKNILKTNEYLFKILSHGLFCFTNTLQVGTILTSSLTDWGVYYQYVIMIYSIINLMSKNPLNEKIIRKFLKFIFRKKNQKNKKINLEEPRLIFCSQKINSLIIFIPRLVFLFIYKESCSPFTFSGTKSCSTQIAEESISNYIPVLLFFLLEIFIIFLCFFYMGLNKNKFMRKILFKENYPYFKILYYMSFQCVYEAMLMIFIEARKDIREF